MDQPLRPLTPEEVEAYDRHGVTHARGLFPDAWIERMAAAVDRVVERPTMFASAVTTGLQYPSTGGNTYGVPIFGTHAGDRFNKDELVGRSGFGCPVVNFDFQSCLLALAGIDREFNIPARSDDAAICIALRFVGR